MARTEVFRVRPSLFEDSVDVAWNAELNFKSSRLGYSVNNAYPSDGATPMDLSYAENDEAELQAAEQHMGVRRCFICRSTSHLQARCPARQRRPAPPRQRSARRTTGLSQGNGNTQ